MKALEKDRNRRYETASAFAADVRRYLSEEPVEARPPSALYRFGKMARRNRAALTTAVLVAAALIAGTVVSVCLAVAAWRAEGEAHNAASEALTAKTEADAKRSPRRGTQGADPAPQRRPAPRALRDQYDAGSGGLGGRRSEPIRRVDAAWCPARTRPTCAASSGTTGIASGTANCEPSRLPEVSGIARRPRSAPTASGSPPWSWRRHTGEFRLWDAVTGATAADASENSRLRPDVEERSGPDGL